MANLDLDSYFDKKLSHLESLDSIPQKHHSVVEALNKKLETLDRYSERLDRYRASQENSFAGKTQRVLNDLFPWAAIEGTDNATYKALNLGAGAVSSISKAVGNATSGVKSLEAFTNEINLDDEDRRILNQFAQDGHPGNLTEEEWNRINRKPVEEVGPTGLSDRRLASVGRNKTVEFIGKLTEALFGKDHSQASSAWELASNADEARKDAAAIRDFFDISDIVDRSTQMRMADAFTDAGADKYLEMLQEGWNLVKAGDKEKGTELSSKALTELGKMAVKIAPEHPDALLLYLAESLPEMVPFMLGGGFTALGAGMAGTRAQANYEEGIQNYQKQNRGATPLSDQRQEMAGWAAGGAAVGVAGDRLLGGMVNRAGKALKGAPKKAGDAPEDQLKKSLRGRATNAAVNTAKGGAGEGAAEGFETFAEGEAKLESATPREIYDATVIGAAIGTGLSGASSTVTEGAGALQDLNKKGNKQLDKVDPVHGEAFKKAVETDDVSALTDPESPTYNPVRAIEALKEIANKPDTTPEARQAHIEQASRIIQEMQLTRRLGEEFSQLPENIERAKQELEILQSRLDSLPEDASDSQREALNRVIEARKRVAEQTPLEGKELQKVLKRAQEVDQQIERAIKARDLMLADTSQKMSLEDLQETVAAANTDVTQASEETVQKARTASQALIQLAMSAPERLNDSDVEALVSNSNNALTADERTFLRSFSQSRQAYNEAKKAGDVLKNILEGEPRVKGKSPGFKGIADFRKEIFNALASRSQAEADAAIRAFRTFLRDQQNKAALAKQVYDSLRPGEETFIQRPRNSTDWQRGDGPISEEQRKRYAALRIAREVQTQDGYLDSGKLVNEMLPLGPQALEAFDAEVQAAYKLAFGENVDTSTPTKVSETPKPTELTEETVGNEVTSVPPTPQQEQNRSTGAQDVANQYETYEKIYALHMASRNGHGKAEIAKVRDQFPDGLTVSFNGFYGTLFFKSPEGKDIVGTFRFDEDTGVLLNLDIRSPDNQPGGSYIGDLRKILKGLQDALPSLNEIIAHRVTGARSSAKELLRFRVEGDRLKLVDRHAVPEGVTDPVMPEAWLTPLNASPTPTPTPQAPTTSSPTSRVSAEQAKKLSDEKLNDQIEALQSKRVVGTATAEDQATFSVLDAEMSAREDAANAALQAEESADLPPPISVQESGEEASNTSGQQGSEEVAGQGRDVPVAEGGRLAITAQKSEPGLPYQEQNLLAGKLTQEESRKGEGTVRPLVVVRDFINNLQGFDWMGALGKKWEGKITDEHRNFLNYFARMARDWSTKIPGILSPAEGSAKDYRYQDLVQFLIQTHEVNGKQVADLEENLKTAISYSGLIYVAETLARNLFNTPQDINRILGRDKDAYVSPEEEAAFAQGMTQHMLIDVLGRHVVEALGLRMKAEEVDGKRVYPSKDLMPKLQAGLGAYVLEMLVNEKLLVERSVELAEGIDGETQQIKLFSLNTSKEDPSVLSQELREIKQVSDKVYPVLADLMGSELNRPMPTFEPVAFNEETADRSLQKNTDQLIEAANAKNAEPKVLNESMYRVASRLSNEALQTIGGVEPVTTETHHVDDLFGAKARNNTITQELQTLFDFVQTAFGDTVDFAQQFFLQHEPWSNGRMGIKSVINPQASKVHREFVSNPDWKVELKSNNTKAMRAFWVRVGDGLGFASDKKLHRVAKGELDKFLAREDIVAAIEAIKDIERNAEVPGYSPTKAQEAAIVHAVSEGREKFHSLQALIAVARYQLAKESAPAGQPFTFTTELRADRDGVANGPILSMLLLGGASTVEGLIKLMKKGGFYTTADMLDGKVMTQFNEWLASDKNNRDLYQTTAGRIWDVAQKRAQDKSLKNLYAALWHLGGNFLDDGNAVTKDGRDRVKALLNPLFFGSGLNKAVNNLADDFIESYKKKIVKAAQANDGSHAALVDAFNLILREGEYKGNLIPHKISAEALKHRPISKFERLAFRKAFHKAIGKDAAAVVEKDFASFLESRNLMTSASQMTFAIYEATKKVLREEFIQGLINRGELKADKEGKPLQDLTAPQENELIKRLEKLLPMAHSYYSKESGKLSQAVRLSKSARAQTQDPLYAGAAYFNRNGKRSRRELRPFINVDTNPGVRILSSLIHSLDSAISHMTQMAGLNAEKKRSLLNMHDSVGGSLASDALDSQTINQMLVKTITTYSPMQEAVDMVLRSLEGLQRLAEVDSDQADKIKAAVAQALVEQVAAMRNREEPAMSDAPLHMNDVETYLYDMILKLEAKAYEADRLKLETLKQINAVGQYAGEEGSYILTDADRATIDEQIKALEEKNGRSEALVVQLQDVFGEAIQKAVDQHMTPGAAKQLAEMNKAELEGVIAGHTSTNRTRAEQVHLLTYLAQINEDLAEAANTVKKALLANQHRNITHALKEVSPEVARELAKGMDAILETIPENYLTGLLQKGDKQNPHNQNLVKKFEANPEQTLNSVAGMLRTELQGLYKSNPVGQFLNLLLEQILKTAPKDLKIVYVTPSTHPDLIIKERDPAKDDIAWYSLSKDGGEVIYIRSTAFKGSHVSVLTLLHELVHHNVVATVAAAQQDKNHPARAFVEELDALRKEILAKHPNSKYDIALNDLQEFIAYGMTNFGFQQEILGSHEAQAPATTRQRIKNYFGQFLEKLSNIFFRGKAKDNQLKAMAVLLTNVAGIMEVAHEHKAQDIARLKQNFQQAMAQTHTPNATEILAALDQGEHSSGFQRHLHQVQKIIVEALHGPFGAFKEQIKATMPTDPLDAYAEAVVNGDTQFTQDVVAAGITLSDQEAFVAEQVYQTVHAAVTEGNSTTSMVYRELDRLYEEVKRKLRPEHFHEGDWLAATQAEQDAARRQYDFVFAMKRGKDNRFDYLARFAALGLAKESLNKALQQPSETFVTAEPEKFMQRLQALFERIARYFSDKVTKTYTGQTVDQKLNTLVKQLVNAEVKRQAQLANPKESLLENVDRAVSKAVGNVWTGTLSKVGQSASLSNSSNVLVRATAITSKVLANDRLTDMIKTVQNLRDNVREDRNGLVMGVLNYSVGVPAKLNALVHWAKNVQGLRQSIIGNVTQNLLGSYNQELNDKQKRAITFSFLRTGAFTIVDRFGLQGLEDLLGDTQRIKREIQNVERVIQRMQPQHAIFLFNQAEALGHHLIHGGSYLEGGLIRNTHNMTRLLGTKFQDSLTQEEMEALKPELDLLVSLYALSNVSAKERAEAQRVLAHENKREDGGNGVEVTVMYYKHLLDESVNRNFRGDRSLTTQYFLPKVLHPRVDLKVASEQEAQELEHQGYVRVAEVPRDPSDLSQGKRYLLVQKDGGLSARTTSALSYLDTHASGSLLGESGDFVTDLKAATVQMRKRQETARLHTQRINAPKQATSNALVPVFNPAGDIVNYAYHMTTEVMDTHLEADHRFEYLLGRLEGGMVEKELAPKVNREVIKFLKTVYDEEYSDRPESFRLISPTSQNAEDRKLYAELPEATKQAVRDIFGKDMLLVPNDLMDAVFGYSTYSILNAFRKEYEDRNLFEKALVMASEWVLETYGLLRGMTQQEAEHFAKTAGIRLRKAELGIEEVIKAIKDTIVIKSIIVALDNIISNQTVLFIEGVPIKKSLELQTKAYRSALKYQNDRKELHRLNMLINSGAFQGNDLNDLVRAALKLEQEIELNPVKKLIDVGLFPTIVEDVSINEDPYSYASLIEEKAQPYLDRIPQGLKNSSLGWLGKQVLMTHDSALYKVMSQLTQMGDFTARYALYEHLTTRKKDPLTHEEALQRASEAFINYDIPLPRSLSYLEAMGFTYFFKYFLGIQRVLARKLKERPVSTLTMHMAGNFIDGFASVTDSSAIHRFGWNPLRASVFEAPTIVTEQAITGGMISALR